MAVTSWRLWNCDRGCPPPECTDPCSPGCPLEGHLCCSLPVICCDDTTDCNENGVLDSCDVDYGISQNCDSNVNDIPDECQDPAPTCLPLIEFSYDAVGRRVAKIDRSVDPPQITRYYYFGQNVITETDELGTTERYYVNGPNYVDERILVHDTATADEHYYIQQELHTITGLVNAVGELVESYVYDAYGKVAMYAVSGGSDPSTATYTAADTSTINPYFFTGRRLDLVDATGLTGSDLIQGTEKGTSLIIDNARRTETVNGDRKGETKGKRGHH